MANEFDDKNKQQSGKQEPATGSVNTVDRTKNDPSRGSEHQSGQNPQGDYNRTPASGSRDRKDPEGSEQGSEHEDKRRAS
jgi:hypothetical protein